MQCCESVTFWYGDPGSDPDPDLSSVADKMPTKKKCLSEVFLLITFEGTFTSVFKNKKSKK